MRPTRETPAVELVALSASSHGKIDKRTDRSASACPVPNSPQRSYPRPRAASLSSSPDEPSKRQRRSAPTRFLANSAHTTSRKWLGQPCSPTDGLCIGMLQSMPQHAGVPSHRVPALKPVMTDYRLHFAPGPWSGKFNTADGHPNHEGIVARPKRSLSPRFPVPLTISMVQALEPEIGSICPHSLERLKRRCVNASGCGN